MKRVRLNNNIKMVGEKEFRGKKRQIHYYLIIPNQDKVYAFTQEYTSNTYNMCKSGIVINKLASVRSRDAGIMKLVKYTNFMLPYLVETYELSTFSKEEERGKYMKLKKKGA